jgi:UDP-N-acetylglucosamine transferase subunit ALG13
VESFRYKPSIVEDINWADLVISHGGAGSILESLRAKKKLIIVVNEKLMHNHQVELAEAMVRNGYAVLASTDSLVETLKNAVSVPCSLYFVAYLVQDFRELKPLPEPNVFPVVTVLLQEVSFTE